MTAYRIKFKQVDNTYSTYLASCDGTNGAIIAALQCTVAMSVFTTAPYSLTVGSLIIA